MKKIFLGFILGLSLSSIYLIYAWVNPTQNPPQGGGVLQTDSSGLNIITTTRVSSGNFLVTSGSVGIGTTAPSSKLDIAGAQFFSDPTAGNYWVNYYLGENADPNPGDIILLIPNPSGTVDFARMVGVITATRGNTGSFRSTKQWYISVSRAYTDRGGSIMPLTEETAMIKLVTCDYGGVNYIALDTTGIGLSAHRWTFTGSWGNKINNQKPILVPRSSCTNITDYKNYHSLGNQIFISNTGNVGIGTTAPAQKLHVAGQSVFGYISGSKTGVYIGNEDSYGGAPFIQGVSSTFGPNNLVINPAGGNVGIGTTAPEAKLDVRSFIQVKGPLTNQYSASGFDLKANETVNYWHIGYRGSLSNQQGSLAFWYYNGSNWIQPLVLSPSGNVGIGTTAPGTDGAKLDVAGPIRSGGWFDNPNKRILLSSPTGWPGITAFDDLGHRGDIRRLSDRWSFAIHADTTIPPEVMVITESGNVGIGTTNPGSYKLYVNGSLYASSYYCASDLNRKKDLKKLENVLDKISQINGYYFKWKDDPEEKIQIGLIAQEVEKVFPELVTTHKNDKGEEEKGLAYERMTAILLEAIKEQQKEIENLKTEIENLKNNQK